MRKLLLPVALVLTVVGAAWAQGAGGAFVPTFAYSIPAQWTWTRLTPWVVKASNTASFAYSLVFATPTANRTITFGNVTGTVQVGSGQVSKTDMAVVTLSGPNPTNYTTTLASVFGCTATLASSDAPNDPTTLTLIATAGQAGVSLYAWKPSSSSVTTLVASSTSGRRVYLACSGS